MVTTDAHVRRQRVDHRRVGLMMQASAFKRLLTFALFFMACWFFGNRYEEIAMIPNQLVNTYATMTAYREYFQVVSPTFYFVPFTQIAVVVTVVLYFNTSLPELKRLLRTAGIF